MTKITTQDRLIKELRTKKYKGKKIQIKDISLVIGKEQSIISNYFNYKAKIKTEDIKLLIDFFKLDGEFIFEIKKGENSPEEIKDAFELINKGRNILENLLNK